MDPTEADLLAFLSEMVEFERLWSVQVEFNPNAEFYTE